jgi:mycothiol maleylpyruvate isomerase-like protein
MGGQSSSSDPILCAHLLRRVDEQLIHLLSSLIPGEWDIQTIAPLWKVRDVAAHLLDTALRKLSIAIVRGVYSSGVSKTKTEIQRRPESVVPSFTSKEVRPSALMGGG